MLFPSASCADLAVIAPRTNAVRPVRLSHTAVLCNRSPSWADVMKWLSKPIVTQSPFPSLAASAIVKSAMVISNPPWTILLELQCRSCTRNQKDLEPAVRSADICSSSIDSPVSTYQKGPARTYQSEAIT